MFYCENCYLLNEENTCAFCGSRLTRGPKMDDYCFIGNKCSPWAEMYHGILKDDHIPVIIRQVLDLEEVLVKKAKAHLDTVMPGYTHARQLEQALMDSSFEQPD